tara:strand:+ start:303 stop:419 length:117 start_codon:yes stop_codon:yes gene_type:complete
MKKQALFILDVVYAALAYNSANFTPSLFWWAVKIFFSK